MRAGRSNVITVVVFLASLAFFSVWASTPGGIRYLQALALRFMSPFLRTGSSIERRFSALREGIKTLEQLESENKQLRITNQELQATNLTLRGLESENTQLRKALVYRDRARFKLVSSRVIGRDSSTWYNTVMIDRGSRDGVRMDMPVVTEAGLVGKTSIVSETDCVVLLVSDESCKVSAAVEGTREQGIVSGERTSGGGVPVMGLQFLTKQANLKSGMRVYTSGLGGVFPAGILLGTVNQYRVRELDGFASLVSSVDLMTLQDVFVAIGEK